MPITLVGDIADPNVGTILMTAAFAHIPLKLQKYTPAPAADATDKYVLNCHCLNEVPVLKTSEGYLMETGAIVRYIARTQRLLSSITAAPAADGSGKNGKNGTAAAAAAAAERYPAPDYPVEYMLYGKTLRESAEVDQWLDFCAERLARPLALLLQGGAGDGAKGDSARRVAEGLAALNLRLERRRELVVVAREMMAAAAASGSAGAGGGVSPRPSANPNSNNNNNNNNGGAFPDDNEMIAYLLRVKAEQRRRSAFYNVAGDVRARHAADYTSNNNNNTETAAAAAVSARPSVRGPAGAAAADAPAPTPRLTLNLNAREGGGGDSPGVSPRPSLLQTQQQQAAGAGAAAGGSARRSGTAGGRNGAAPAAVKYVFLVGDSLTAADIVVALTLHAVLRAEASVKRAAPPAAAPPGPLKSAFANNYDFYKTILSLPVAADMCKILGIKLC